MRAAVNGVMRVDHTKVDANARAMSRGNRVQTTARRTAVFAAAVGLAGACVQHAIKNEILSGPEARPVAVAQPHAAEADLGDPRHQYLVHDDSKIVLRTLDGKAERVLADNAWNVLYHPSLELIWYVRDEALHVIDLRTPDFTSIRIATGFTSDMGDLKVEHPNGSASDNDLCDVELTRLSFGEPPVFELIDENMTPPVFENAAWLVQQQKRPARELPASRTFSSEKKRHVRGRKRECQVNPEECGATLPLGARGTELVVVGNEQGDCYHRYCLLYDPVKKLYSTPPNGAVWSAPAKLEAPECELYKFAADDLTFFTYSQLCIPGESCVDVSGAVLGWRVPGGIVGD